MLDDEAPKVKVNGCGENSRAHMSRAPLDAALVVQPFSPLSILISRTHMSRRHVDCSAITMRSPSRTRRMMHLQRSSLRTSGARDEDRAVGDDVLLHEGLHCKTALDLRHHLGCQLRTCPTDLARALRHGKHTAAPHARRAAAGGVWSSEPSASASFLRAIEGFRAISHGRTLVENGWKP